MSQEEHEKAVHAARWPELGDEPEPDADLVAFFEEEIGWTEDEESDSGRDISNSTPS
jgi:hypothetical protein